MFCRLRIPNVLNRRMVERGSTLWLYVSHQFMSIVVDENDSSLWAALKGPRTSSMATRC